MFDPGVTGSGESLSEIERSAVAALADDTARQSAIRTAAVAIRPAKPLAADRNRADIGR